MRNTKTRPSGTEPGQRQLNGIQDTGRPQRNLSSAKHAISEHLDVAVPMSDGVTLMADVFRPDAEGRFPALLAFSPYPRQIQNSRLPLGFVEAGASDFFVPRGYAHVIANARSTGGSGGEWTLLDAAERQDLYDLVEWIAAQPWCDGNVGMLGISYFAMAQLGAAAAKPPSLKAIFPIGTNERVWDVAYHHGLATTSFLGPWFGAIGMTSTKSSEFWRGHLIGAASSVVSNAVVHQRLAHVNGEALLAVLKNVLRGGYPAVPFDKLWQELVVEHPTYDDYWADRDVTALLGEVDIPIYLGCDWDNVIMHLPGTFTTWKALERNQNVYLSMLPEGGLNWPWESLHYEALAWYDHWLKGIDTGITEGPRVRYYVPGADQWYEADQWPPADTALQELALRADGTLGDAAETPIPGGSRSYLHRQADLAQAHGASKPDLPDRLTWNTAPLSADLDMVGPVELILDASITNVDTSWNAILDDVAPDGTAAPITGGWLRATLRTVDEAASEPGRPVVPCTTAVAVTPGEVVRYRIPVVPTARRLAPGHALRLTLSSADDAKDGTAILGFTHEPVRVPTINTVHDTSRLLLSTRPTC